MMKKTLVFFTFLLISFHNFSQIMWQFNSDTVVNWYYAGGDEFNGTSLNSNYWMPTLWARNLYLNKEQQYYTNGNNSAIKNGILELRAKKEKVSGKIIDALAETDSLFHEGKFKTLNASTFNYTSGQIVSIEKFNKGFFECRLKIPSEKGYWPAFWMHGGDPYEEIDVLESVTSRPGDIHVDTHCGKRCDMVWRGIARESFGAWIKTKVDFSKDFNTVACEWDEEHIKYYLNGEFIAISPVQFNVPKHITINLAVPSTGGPFGPGPDGIDTTACFEIDYVRVWKKENRESDLGNVPYTFSKADTSIKASNESLLKKTGRSYYGKKRNAKKEGIKISMLRSGNLFYFSMLGNIMGENPRLTINKDTLSMINRTFIKTAMIVDLSTLEKGEYSLLLSWKNRQTTFPIIVQ